MKAVCIEQNGQKVLMAVVPDDAGTPVAAEALPLSSAQYPETTQEVRQFIDQNSMKSLNLHKVEDGVIKLRSAEELAASEFLTWEYAFELEAVEG